MAPTRAMKGVFSLLSNICRQFLVGLARLAGGSSRESVSTLVETIPSPCPGFPEQDDRPLSQRPTRNARSQQHCEGLASRRRLATSAFRRGRRSLTAMLDVRPGSFGNPLLRRQGGTGLEGLAKTLCTPHGCCSAQSPRQVIRFAILPPREFQCCNAAS